MNQEQMLLIDRQKAIETFYDKRNAFKLVKDRLTQFIKPELLNKTVVDIITILILREKKTSINAIIEILLNSHDKTVDPTDIMENLIKLTKNNLVTLTRDSKERLYAEFKYTLKQEDKDLIDQYCYQLPLIIMPLKVNHKKDNKGDGYYTIGSKSLILNNHHTEDICADTLNLVNSIPYTINEKLMRNIRNSWKSMNDERTVLEEKQYWDSFNDFEKSVFGASAVMIKNGNKFYFTHRYDFRGRIYCCGYQLNYQGNSYAKAQLEFANKQIVEDKVNFF